MAVTAAHSSLPIDAFGYPGIWLAEGRILPESLTEALNRTAGGIVMPRSGRLFRADTSSRYLP